MKVQAIIPTAGIGERLKTDTPKPFVEICGKPLCVHALEAFQQSPVIDSVILIGHPESLCELGSIVKKYGLSKVVQVVAGGATRRASVAKGLEVLDSDTDVVAIHDGARPFVSTDMIRDAVALIGNWEAVIVAVPVKSTVKRAGKENLIVQETLERSGLWEIQTPQVFRREILLRAHRENKDESPTDDAMMVEQLGVKVKILLGNYKNIKVTTQEDLAIAEVFCGKKQKYVS